MGIKCYCPNGHKMHVKEFLAGKTGICPDCGARVEIPLTSVTAKPWTTTPGPQPNAAPSSVPETMVATASELLPTSDEQSAPAAPASRPRGTAEIKAFAEAPNATWYVHLSSGEQLGPARQEAVRGWLDQGRIDAEALVWREGWPQWQEAAKVFPQLRAAAAADQTLPSAEEPRANLAVPLEIGRVPGSASTTLVRMRRRTKKEQRAMLSLFLLGLVVVLFAVLLWLTVLK